jgi:hypothetical protein
MSEREIEREKEGVRGRVSRVHKQPKHAELRSNRDFPDLLAAVPGTRGVLEPLRLDAVVGNHHQRDLGLQAPPTPREARAEGGAVAEEAAKALVVRVDGFADH